MTVNSALQAASRVNHTTPKKQGRALSDKDGEHSR